MAADAKSAEVFTAIKSLKKHEAESRIRSKVSPIVAVVPPPKELLDSRLFSNAGVDYIKDTLQVFSVFLLYLIVSPGTGRS